MSLQTVKLFQGKKFILIKAKLFAGSAGFQNREHLRLVRDNFIIALQCDIPDQSKDFRILLVKAKGTASIPVGLRNLVKNMNKILHLLKERGKFLQISCVCADGKGIFFAAGNILAADCVFESILPFHRKLTGKVKPVAEIAAHAILSGQ